MRDLISRKAAIEDVHSVIFDFFDICEDDSDSPMTESDKRLLRLNKAITTALRRQPTIDPAENGGCWGCCCERLGQVEIVKHGKWIHDDLGWHCSGCWAMYPEEITDEINYCPNCGARMEQE